MAKRKQKSAETDDFAKSPTQRALERLTAVERQEVAAAARAKKSGEKLTAPQRTLLDRVKRLEGLELQRDHLRAVPQWMFRELARDIQTKQLRDWRDRYGAPVADRTINLAEVFVWLRRFLADNHRKLNAPDDDDPLLAGAASPALEEYRRWKAKAAKLDVQERERSLLRRDEMRAMHGRVAGILRQAGATLGRQFGVEAQTILDEALDDVERDVRDFFADGNHNDEPGT